jgi:putative molybdopterin biosynthesis protein
MTEHKPFLNTREVAGLLDINEKMVYALIADKGLPASKATGKWLFPKHLVEAWVENQTVNYPKTASPLPRYEGLLVLAGSNDVLLDRVVSLFNRTHTDHLGVFGNLGSMGGVRALRRNLCHIASSHLLQENDRDYNFGFLGDELEQVPAVVGLCRREQGLMVGSGNPKAIGSVKDLARPDVTLVNRAVGTGTRLLFDRLLVEAGIEGRKIRGYDREVQRHLDVGLEVLSGRANAGPGIRAVASMLGLGFIPWRWERYDLIILKERFFDRGVQLFLGLLHDSAVKELASDLDGYDLSVCGKMIYPGE